MKPCVCNDSKTEEHLIGLLTGSFPIPLKIYKEKTSCVFQIYNFEIYFPLQTIFQVSK